MPCLHDADDDLGDDKYPDEPEADEDDDETVPCPYCRADVYEGAERCPDCGHYLSQEDAPRRRPGWQVVGVLICLALTLQGFFWWWWSRG